MPYFSSIILLCLSTISTSAELMLDVNYGLLISGDKLHITYPIVHTRSPVNSGAIALELHMFRKPYTGEKIPSTMLHQQRLNQLPPDMVYENIETDVSMPKVDDGQGMYLAFVVTEVRAGEPMIADYTQVRELIGNIDGKMGFYSTPGSEIAYVMWQMHLICSQTPQTAEEQSERLERLMQVNISSCPEDFKTAYLDVLRSFNEIRQVVEDQSGLSGFIRGAMRGLEDPTFVITKLPAENAAVQSRLENAVFNLRLIEKKYADES